MYRPGTRGVGCCCWARSISNCLQETKLLPILTTLSVHHAPPQRLPVSSRDRGGRMVHRGPHMQRESRRLTRFTIKHTARRHSETTRQRYPQTRSAERLRSRPIQRVPELPTLPPVRTRSVGRRTALSLQCFAQTFIVSMDGSGHHFSRQMVCASWWSAGERGDTRAGGRARAAGMMYGLSPPPAVPR